MGWNYRKRINLGGGVSLNIGKNGISTSTRICKGVTINSGKRGTYVTNSIPGTGIYKRTRIGGGTSQRSRSSRSQTFYTPPAEEPGVGANIFMFILILGVEAFLIWATINLYINDWPILGTIFTIGVLLGALFLYGGYINIKEAQEKERAKNE